MSKLLEFQKETINNLPESKAGGKSVIFFILHSKYHIPTDDLKLFINQEQPRRYICMYVMALDYQPLLDCLGCSKLLQTAVSAGAVVHKFLQLSETNGRENTM